MKTAPDLIDASNHCSAVSESAVKMGDVCGFGALVFDESIEICREDRTVIPFCNGCYGPVHGVVLGILEEIEEGKKPLCDGFKHPLKNDFRNQILVSLLFLNTLPERSR
jgi:hypothetical protein